METLILSESEECTEGDGGYYTASHRWVFRNHSTYTIYTQVNRLLQYLNLTLSNPRQSTRMLEIKSQFTPKCKRKCLYLKENIKIRHAFMSAKRRFWCTHSIQPNPLLYSAAHSKDSWTICVSCLEVTDSTRTPTANQTGIQQCALLA